MKRALTLLVCALLVAACGGDEQPRGDGSTSEAVAAELRAAIEDLAAACDAADADRLKDRLPSGHRGGGGDAELPPPAAATTRVTAFDVIEVAGDTAAVSVTLALDEDGTTAEAPQVVHLAREDDGPWHPTAPLVCPPTD